MADMPTKETEAQSEELEPLDTANLHLPPSAKRRGETQSILAYQGCSGTFFMVLDVGRWREKQKQSSPTTSAQSLETVSH